MSDTSVEARIAALEGRVANLERQRWQGEPRLGPQSETPEQQRKQVERFTEEIKNAIKGVVPVDRSKVCTTSGRPPDVVRAEQTEETGQHKDYIVLCAEERAKGFVRPYRDAYKHVGPKICGLHVGPNGATVCYMNPDHAGKCGDVIGPRPQACHTVTTMGRALSETYARDPKFYGATFCCGCNRHLPVNEFVWTADGQEVGS